MISVHTLGTGSGKPTPERNVSCTAVFRQGDVILFDCGEGTQMQITRSQLRPGDIKLICITHFHGDHINGLPGLLGTLQLNQRTEPLTVIGPKGIRSYLSALSKLGVLGIGYKLVVTEVSEPGVVLDMGEYTIAADRLKHRVPCWGYRLSEPDRPGRFNVDQARDLGVPPGPLYGRLQRGEDVTLPDGRIIASNDVVGEPRRGLSVAYCLDTEPCDGAVRLAAGVDLLIHEGTYAPGEERVAHDRGHSSMIDAAETAVQAGAQRLVVTHVSSKYPRVNGFLKDVRKVMAEADIASDLDVFELGYVD